MPRPKRARRDRQPAPKDAEVATEAAAVSTTPTKQTTSPQSGSSEKENRPAPDASMRASLRGSVQQRRALFDATRRRDSALLDLEAEDVTTSDSIQDWALGDDTTGLRGRDRLRRNEVSGLDLDLDEADLFASMYSGIDRPPSRGRSANNTSTISAGQFVRRSRAPSVVSRDGGPIRPSSRGVNTPSVSSTFNFGRFRRRAREPSILSMDRRTRRETLSDEELDDLELEGEFAPDAESTPLERRRSRAAAPESIEPAPRTSGVRSRKRKSIEMEGEEEVRLEKSPRVEQAEEDGENNEDGPDDVEEDAASVSDGPGLEDDAASVSDDSSLSSLSSPRSPGSPIPDRGRPTTPVNLDEIMAPPASSGSEAAEWPSIRKLARRRRRMSPSTPLRAGLTDYASDVSSPPSLTHSPNFPQPKKGAKPRGRQAKRQPSPSPLTAHLASLLPQRRAKQIRGEADDVDSGDDIDVSRLADDEDELAFTHTRSRTRNASRTGSRARQPQSANKKQAPASGRRVTQTYGGRDSADDSFGPLPDDSFEGAGLVIEDPRDELRKAASKFREVDRWELEFEEVTREASPRDAR
ncbi:MAG: hypothetical protein IMZ46_11125 [Acidobacteria bacterium]|nr:hypothetical protein [Acidobacteriota bacterium]